MAGPATTYYVKGVDGRENRRVAGKKCTFVKVEYDREFVDRRMFTSESGLKVYTYPDGIPRFIVGPHKHTPKCYMPPSEWTFVQVEELAGHPVNEKEEEEDAKKKKKKPALSKRHYGIVWDGYLPELVNSNGRVKIVNSVKRSDIDRSGETEDRRTIYLMRPPGKDRITQVLVSDFLEQRTPKAAKKKRKNLIAANYSEFLCVHRHEPIDVMPNADFEKMCRLHQQHCASSYDYRSVDVDADDYVKYALLRKRLRGEGLEDEYIVDAPIFDGGAVLYPLGSAKRRRRD